MTMRVLSVAVGVLLAATCALGVEENFCAVPEHCVDDKLKVVFASTGTSELSNVTVGQEIEVHVLLDVKLSPIQGFSYGVAHDTAVLEILSATGKGALNVIAPAAWTATKIAQDKLGFIQSMVLTFEYPPIELPVRDNLKLAIAKYRVLAVPVSDSKLRFTNGLRPPGSPEFVIVFSIAGWAKYPKTVDNAVIGGSNPLSKFSRGDANGDGSISLADAIVSLQNVFLSQLVLFDCEDMLDANDDGVLDISDPVFLLNYLFRSGPPLPGPFKRCGQDGESDALRCKQPNCG